MRSAAGCRAISRLERLTRALDDPGPPQPVEPAGAEPARGAAAGPDLGHGRRPAQGRPVRFLRPGDPQASEHRPGRCRSFARGGRARPSTRCFEQWLQATTNAIPTSCGRAPSGCFGRGDPPDAARFVGAAAARGDRLDRRGRSARTRPTGRRPLAAEADGEAALAGVTVYGRADRIDRLADGGLAIIDYKTGKPPVPESGRRGLRASARAARPDRPRRRVRGRDRRPGGVRILVAGARTAAISGG